MKWFYFILIIFFLHNLEASARNYDTYRSTSIKGAPCSAIGGACSSDDDPENSFFQNPASLVFTNPGFVYDADYISSANLERGMKLGNQVNEWDYMGGVAWGGEKWGLGVALTGKYTKVQSNAAIEDQAVNVVSRSSTIVLNFPFSYRTNASTTVGAAFKVIFHESNFVVDGSNPFYAKRLKEFPSVGITLGVLHQYSKTLRLGSWFQIPQGYSASLQIDTLALTGQQIKYNEDYDLYFPWIWANGIAIMPFEDERTIFLDLRLIGNTVNGYLFTYDTFTSDSSGGHLLEKGRKIILEPRLGWRSPWRWKSRGSYMLGTYLDNPRIVGKNILVHGTAGISYKVLHWLEPMIGFDASKNFFQLLITFI